MAIRNAGGIWGPIDETLRDLEAGIRSARARDINSQGLRDVARQVVRDFFRAVRPQLMSSQISTLDEVDELFQLLLQLANKRSPRSAYLALLRQLNALRARVEIEYERRSSAVAVPATFALDATGSAITARLSELWFS